MEIHPEAPGMKDRLPLLLWAALYALGGFLLIELIVASSVMFYLALVS